MTEVSFDDLKVVDQYIECTRLLLEYFSLAPDECYLEDGIGCCAFVNKSIVEEGLRGVAGEALIKMREQRLAAENFEQRSVCEYHKPGEGCILGELKSPMCIVSYCGDARQDYSVKYLYDALEEVLEGDFEDNLLRVEKFKLYVNALIEKAKTSEALKTE